MKKYIVVDDNHLSEVNDKRVIELAKKDNYDVVNPYFENTENDLGFRVKNLLKSKDIYVFYDGRSKDIHFDLGALSLFYYLYSKNFLFKMLFKVFGLKKKRVYLGYNKKAIKNKKYIKYLENKIKWVRKYIR